MNYGNGDMESWLAIGSFADDLHWLIANLHNLHRPIMNTFIRKSGHSVVLKYKESYTKKTKLRL